MVLMFLSASPGHVDTEWKFQQIPIVNHPIRQPPEITMYQQFSSSSLYNCSFSPPSSFFLPNDFSTFTPNIDLLQSRFQPPSRPKLSLLKHLRYVLILSILPLSFTVTSDIKLSSVFVPPACNNVGSYSSSESLRFGGINGILLHRVHRRWPSKDFTRLSQIGLPPDHRNAKAFGLFGAAA